MGAAQSKATPALLPTTLVIKGSRCALVKKVSWRFARDYKIKLKGRREGRARSFTELLYSWTCESEGTLCSLATLNRTLYVLSEEPLELHSYSEDLLSYHVTELGAHLPYY